MAFLGGAVIAALGLIAAANPGPAESRCSVLALYYR
jgi:hypothetical protein